MTTNHPSDVLCPLPRRIERVRVSITSPLVQPSPNGRRVGIRIVTFEACSGFTRVTARRIAQPPKVTFVTRLRSRQLPSETARQLPDLSTIIRVEPSSTDDSRLQGALPARDMRLHPIGTGPFKFVEFKPNEVIRVTRNPDYWKPGRPYLDGIEWHIIKDIATRNLTFIAGAFDISSPYGTTVPLLEDVKKQAPQAVCELTATNVARNLILNPE